MSDPIQTVALRIVDLRDIAGLSQEEVAERAGVPFEEYVAYESVPATSPSAIFSILQAFWALIFLIF